MGSRVGVAEVAARRVGLTVAEYAARVAAGLKWCWRCRDWHDVGAFAVDRSRGDGRTSTCRASRNARERRRYLERTQHGR